MHRSSGILAHPTSLPGPFPIGDLGATAYEWIDWLSVAEVTWWQTLPINPPGFAASPYQALSAFAGNPLLIAPDLLLADGLIDTIAPAVFDPTKVDFAEAEAWKRPMLMEAGLRLRGTEAVASFRSRHASWLDDYALFGAIKNAHDRRAFFEWPDDLRRRRPAAIAAAHETLADEIEQIVVEQYLFFDQWGRMRQHAQSRGIRLIGDLPIFVAADSADLWMRPELFDLDADGEPRVVAGVPPDYFIETGQLWGNPQYLWSAHAAEGYAWWIDRLRHLHGLVDLIRIDHFRAFADYWEIPAGSDTAATGRWVLGPGRAFFDAVESDLGSLPLIAEDLGEMHPIVPALRDAVGLPGMKISQFSFDKPPDPPSQWEPHTIGYPGTHDNDTIVGWWTTASEVEKERAAILEGIHHSTVAHDVLRAVWRSPSVLAVAQIQDVLGLGTEARMNTPGTVGPHNWTWRLPATPSTADADMLLALNIESRRLRS